MNRVQPSENDMTDAQITRPQSAVSIHYNEEAQNVDAKLVGGLMPQTGDSVQEGEEARWIRANIKCRECRIFVKDANDSDNEDPKNPKCECGYLLLQHRNYKEALENRQKIPGSQWGHTTHASNKFSPTNAFGEIEFLGHGEKQAKYVRVDTETEMRKMLHLMMDEWHMEHPNLLISVTGGAKNFVMRARLKDAFRRGLMKAAMSTGAWIITGGTNAGVMKHVGEAVRDYGLTAEGQVIAIGIAPWGCVQKKEDLISDDYKGKWPASYQISDEAAPKQSFLDPNHSHFILVDNGTQLKFATEIEFRAKLEKEISLMNTSTGSDAVKVPVALLVLEGGPGTLKTVHSAISNNTPAIVIKGSGKCADVLGYAAQNAQETEIEIVDQKGKQSSQTSVLIDAKLESEIKDMVKQVFGENNITQHLEWVKNCVQKPHLLTVFELDARGNTSRDVDMAILKALLKANKDQVMDQLKLALAWNRIDIAKSEIFNEERSWQTGALNNVMMSAIQLDRVDFVDLFLDNGVMLKDFLTAKRLLTLYNEIPRNSLLFSLLTKKYSNQHKFSLKDVGRLIQELIGDYYVPHYLKNTLLLNLNAEEMLAATEKQEREATSNSVISKSNVNLEVSPQRNTELKRPSQELFLWAVLMNRQNLAKLFWKEGNEPIAAALVANSLLKAMIHHTDDTDVAQKLQENADEFEDLAIGVLNNCYSVNEQRAQELLIRELPHWGYATCVLIAVQADNKRFISQTACQSLLNTIWMGKMSQDNSLFKLLPCMFIPPLTLLLIKFQDEEKARLETLTAKSSVTAKIKVDSGPVPPVRREATLINLHDKEKETVRKKSAGLPFLEKLRLFYTAPVIIFCSNCISYLLFLGLYSYIIVVQLSPTFHATEGVLIVWVFTILIEEIRQLGTNYAHSVRSKLAAYLTDSWNVLDIITIILFTIGIILRFIQNDSCFEAARVILAINLLTFFFRILHIFSVNKELGPKLVMIRRMVRDLMWFVVILLVFIGAYAITSEAILYPNSELSWKLLYYLPRKAYWQIYGELFLDVIEGTNDSCTSDPVLYSDYNQQRCPSPIGKYLVPILLGGYVLMTNILLLNLLIAMFSYTFQMVQEKTDVHWNYQRFNLIHEYYSRPFLPPPLIIFYHLILILKHCFDKCSRGEKTSDFRKRFENPNEEKQLVQWENIIADTYFTKLEANESESVQGRLKVVMQKLEGVHLKMDDLSEGQMTGGAVAQQQPAAAIRLTPAPPIKQVLQMPPQLEQRLLGLEQQMTTTCQALDWIMRSLEAKDIKCNISRPPLLHVEKQKLNAKDEEKNKLQVEKQESQKELIRKLKLHVASRSSIYPGSFVQRFPVPDEYVSWNDLYPDYEPVVYTADNVLSNPTWADSVDLMELTPQEREGKILFNARDSSTQISRISFLKKYQVVEGLPHNPMGRTGIVGRGLLGRWGPNFASDPLVTRWKLDDKGKRTLIDGKPVLEFIAIKRTDNKMWAIPGAILKPGEKPWDILTKYFTLEALGSLMDDPAAKIKIDDKIKALSQMGKELYKGYADDARNTDNAWLETTVVNYHDNEGNILQHFALRAGHRTDAVSWLTVTSKMALHGSHLYFLKLTANEHNAWF